MSESREPSLPEKIVYFRRELPPLSETVEAEHVVEADSPHVPLSAHPDEVWTQCSDALTAEVVRRIEQEVQRQGGSCAHVVDEAIEPHHDYTTSTMWQRGRYSYVLYRHETGRTS